MHASNSIIKFAEDTTVVGLITNNDETAYREVVRALGVWCQENNLILNVNKTKEMIVTFRKQQREQPPIHIDGTVVEKVESFKFLGVSKLNKVYHSAIRFVIKAPYTTHHCDLYALVGCQTQWLQVISLC